MDFFSSTISLTGAITLGLLLLSYPLPPDAEVVTEFSETGCTSISAVVKFVGCMNSLETHLRQALIANGKISHTSYCCAVASLRSCVIEEIGGTCGIDVQRTAAKIINLTAKKYEYINEDKLLVCEEDVSYYENGSPLCWPSWAHAVTMMVIVFSMSCCLCCYLKKRERRVPHPHPRILRRTSEYSP